MAKTIYACKSLFQQEIWSDQSILRFLLLIWVEINNKQMNLKNQHGSSIKFMLKIMGCTLKSLYSLLNLSNINLDFVDFDLMSCWKGLMN